MRILTQLSHMWQNQRLQILITTAAFVGIYLFVNSSFGQSDFTWWSKNWDAVIGITTFLIAFFVWLGETNQDWENKLPKKLTVKFKYKFPEQSEWQLIMKCSNAFLAGEGDIRQWAQQIGKQMNNDNWLNFLPFMELSDTPKNQKKGKKWYKFYEVTIYLTKKPDIGNDEENTKFNTQYLHWTSKLEKPEDFEKKWMPRT